MKNELSHPILAVIGLGNPGPKYLGNRHNIGFLVVDALADRHNASWQHKDIMDLATIRVNDKNIVLIKPQTFMNRSGGVLPFLNKQGIKNQNILVVHDELEYPFGKIKIRFGGSARGHNGLRSIIDQAGKEFARLRFGIGRPERKEDVSKYVLEDFSEPPEELGALIEQAVDEIEKAIAKETP